MFPRLRIRNHARPATDRTDESLRMGLFEASVWALGYLAAQTLVLALFLLLMILFAFGGFPSRDRLVEVVLELNLETSLLLTAISSLGALFVLVPAVRVRTGRQARNRLWIRSPDAAQFILALGAVVPLAILSNSIYARCLAGWSWLTNARPELLPASRFESLEMVRGQVSGVPFLVAVVVLALGPAIGEELVFRGVIGQGLIRRRGLVTGVAVSSLLFAAVHLFPPHALATIPLALFFHFAYLTTRNFWIPVALHCGNNALAVMLLKYPGVRQLPESPVVLICSLMYLSVVAVLLWNRRTGRTECATRVPLPRWMFLTASGCIMGFTTAFIWNV
jgi:membrane protease YdiL (CAAX protease family)